MESATTGGLPSIGPSAENHEHELELGSLRASHTCRESTPANSEPDRQFAEFDPHLGPQVVIPSSDAPEPVVLPPTPLRIVEYAFVDDPSPPRAGWVGKVVTWISTKPYLAAAAVSGLLGFVLLIVLPIVLHDMSTNGDMRYDPGLRFHPPNPPSPLCCTRSLTGIQVLLQDLILLLRHRRPRVRRR